MLDKLTRRQRISRKAKTVEANETYIESLLDVSPLDNRLEAAIYIYAESVGLPAGGDQQKMIDFAQDLADWIGDYVYVDVGRKP
jgi:hypothetical protein